MRCLSGAWIAFMNLLLMLSLPTGPLASPKKRWWNLGQRLLSILPVFPASPSSPKNEHPPGKRCQLGKQLMPYCGCGSGCSPWLLLCVFSLASIDIFNSCFSCPFRGSLKTFVHTVHLLQKQTELGSLPVADVLYRLVELFCL